MHKIFIVYNMECTLHDYIQYDEMFVDISNFLAILTVLFFTLYIELFTKLLICYFEINN